MAVTRSIPGRGGPLLQHHLRIALTALVLLPLIVSACGETHSPEQRELATLEQDLRQLDADIAGMKRVASASGEAPPGELAELEEKRDALTYKIQQLKDRIANKESDE